MTIRAVRNNNPGNIDKGQAWRGLMPREKMNPEQVAEPRFCVFETPAYGFRAIAEILVTYAHVFLGAGKIFNVENIIERWAPPSENNTLAYIEHVTALTGFQPLQALMPTAVFIRPLAKAISTHEVGSWAFNDADLAQGLSLAGV